MGSLPSHSTWLWLPYTGPSRKPAQSLPQFPRGLGPALPLRHCFPVVPLHLRHSWLTAPNLQAARNQPVLFFFIPSSLQCLLHCRLWNVREETFSLDTYKCAWCPCRPVGDAKRYGGVIRPLLSLQSLWGNGLSTQVDSKAKLNRSREESTTHLVLSSMVSAESASWAMTMGRPAPWSSSSVLEHIRVHVWITWALSKNASIWAPPRIIRISGGRVYTWVSFFFFKCPRSFSYLLSIGTTELGGEGRWWRSFMAGETS